MEYRVTRSKTYTLEHHGVKGQKWGVRRYGKELGYYEYNRYKHPIASLGPNYKAAFKHPFSVKKNLDYSNTALKAKLEAKKAAKMKKALAMKMSDVKGQKWDAKKYLTELGYYEYNRYKHPIASLGPNYKAAAKHPLSVKKNLDYSNTALKAKLEAKKSLRVVQRGD